MRRHRSLALGATVLALTLLAAACSKSSSGGGATLASTFVFGAPPDCATNKFCAIGLKNVYGIVFKQVRTTDFGGPITVHALKAGSIQVGELFSTSVYDPDFVVLTDDKHLEAADNIVPVIRKDVDTPTIDGILTLGPSVAGPALAAVTASGKSIHLATFDLSADVLTAIKDGKMDFAIDQQQFLQGYLPIVILTNYAETRNLPTGDGTGLIMTGPGFVTKDNAADVIALAAKGLR